MTTSGIIHVKSHPNEKNHTMDAQINSLTMSINSSTMSITIQTGKKCRVNIIKPTYFFSRI